MNISDMLKNCPWSKKPVDPCPADLAACNSSLKAAQDANTLLAGKLDDTEQSLATITSNLQSCNTDLGKAQLAYALLTKGPAAPAKENLRLLSDLNWTALLVDRLGQPFLDCLNRGGVHRAWPPWLVAKQSDILRFLDFYNTNILPLMKDYIVLDWVDTKGNKAQVSGRTCSDFSDLFQGLPTLYSGWTPLAWGRIWAYVESLFLTGGHAFNIIVCWDMPFTEDSISGLSLLEIEPQTSGRWTAAGVAMDDSAKVEALDLKPITPERFSGVEGGYKIDEIYMVAA